MSIINNAIGILKITEDLTVGEKYYFYEQVSEALSTKKHTTDVDFLKDIKAILRNDMTLHVGSLNDIDVNVANKSLSNSSPIGLFTSLISEHTL
jgi:hypothetical protein